MVRAPFTNLLTKYRLYFYLLLLVGGTLFGWFLCLSPTEMMTLALVLIGAYGIIENYRMTSTTENEMKLRETPQLSFELSPSIELLSNLKDNELYARCSFIIKNPSMISIEYTLLQKALKVSVDGHSLPQKFRNLGGLVGVFSQSQFFLDDIPIADINNDWSISQVAVRVSAAFRYWSTIRPSEKYDYEYAGAIEQYGSTNNKQPLFRFYNNKQKISKYDGLIAD